MQLTEKEKIEIKEELNKQKATEKKEEGGSDAESDDNDKGGENNQDGEKKKKKKKKNKNKKKNNKDKEELEALIQGIDEIPEEQLKAQTQTNQRFRCLGGWPNIAKFKFPNNQFDSYPANQLQEYKPPRVKNEETKAKEALTGQNLQYLRKGAEIQRQVRRFAQRIVKPGRKLIDICEQLENYNRKLAPENGILSGIAFPTGISINNCAAHYTPNPGDNRVLGQNDVCKIDFGTHIQGRIIDTAFTVAFNPTFDNLLAAVKDATNTGIREAGIDARLGEVGAAIQQTMESYEVQIGGKNYPVRVVKNLNGHSIQPYKIHAGKTVPCVKTNSNVKMQEGEVYAIETFGSTGKAFVKQEGDCSHYMKDFYVPKNAKIPNRSKAFLNFIDEKFSTLCFCKRWLQRFQAPNYILQLRDLVQNGIINPYPPLCDVQGSYVAQWEHTLILRPTCKEILSRGDDY